MNKDLIALAEKCGFSPFPEMGDTSSRWIVLGDQLEAFAAALSCATPAGEGSKDERRAFEPEQLAQAIRVRASIAGIGLNELERRAGWKPGDMYGVLKTNMTMKSLQRFADALGIPAWMLLRDSATNAAVAAISREQS